MTQFNFVVEIIPSTRKPSSIPSPVQHRHRQLHVIGTRDGLESRIGGLGQKILAISSTHTHTYTFFNPFLALSVNWRWRTRTENIAITPRLLGHHQSLTVAEIKIVQYLFKRRCGGGGGADVTYHSALANHNQDASGPGMKGHFLAGHPLGVRLVLGLKEEGSNRLGYQVHCGDGPLLPVESSVRQFWARFTKSHMCEINSSPAPSGTSGVGIPEFDFRLGHPRSVPKNNHPGLRSPLAPAPSHPSPHSIQNQIKSDLIPPTTARYGMGDLQRRKPVTIYSIAPENMLVPAEGRLATEYHTHSKFLITATGADTHHTRMADTLPSHSRPYRRRPYMSIPSETPPESPYRIMPTHTNTTLFAWCPTSNVNPGPGTQIRAYYSIFPPMGMGLSIRTGHKNWDMEYGQDKYLISSASPWKRSELREAVGGKKRDETSSIPVAKSRESRLRVPPETATRSKSAALPEG
ncbi:hypothetical protein B0H11DRAFT_2363530 [Mycena galericulata]|nr:hypothetical protein B0H11DRAFT_2363530 [Mycena galericulata]